MKKIIFILLLLSYSVHSSADIKHIQLGDLYLGKSHCEIKNSDGTCLVIHSNRSTEVNIRFFIPLLNGIKKLPVTIFSKDGEIESMTTHYALSNADRIDFKNNYDYFFANYEKLNNDSRMCLKMGNEVVRLQPLFNEGIIHTFNIQVFTDIPGVKCDI